MDTLTYTCRVTAPEPELARVSIGRRQFSVGRPLEFDDATSRVSALDYLLGAVGGEVVNGLRVFAARRRLALEAIEAVVTADLAHGLAYLEVIGESGPPRVTRIHVKVFVACDDGAAMNDVLREALDRLPLVCTLRTTLDLRVDLTRAS